MFTHEIGHKDGQSRDGLLPHGHHLVQKTHK